MKTLTKDQYDFLKHECGESCAGNCSLDNTHEFSSGIDPIIDTLMEDGYIVLDMCQAGGEIRHYYLTPLAKQAMNCFEFASNLIEGALA